MVAMSQKHSVFPQPDLPLTHAASPLVNTGAWGSPKATPQPVGSGARKVGAVRSERTYIQQLEWLPRMCTRLLHVIRCAPSANAKIRWRPANNVRGRSTGLALPADAASVAPAKPSTTPTTATVMRKVEVRLLNGRRLLVTFVTSHYDPLGS
jgi:hypothetical protein